MALLMAFFLSRGNSPYMPILKATPPFLTMRLVTLPTVE